MSVGPPSPPNYDDVKLAGPSTPRVPLESQGGSLDIYKEVDLGAISASVTLSPQQAAASLITATPSSAVTLLLPGLQSGKRFVVQNYSTASANTLTVSAAGYTTTYVVGSNTSADLIQSMASSGIIAV